jgi:hypothetical protein
MALKTTNTTANMLSETPLTDEYKHILNQLFKIFVPRPAT